MNITAARSAITLTLERMNALYHDTLFDEWVLVKLPREQSAILAYEGPRVENYQRKFRQDVAPLRAELEQRQMEIGDFAFAPAAEGTQFDACIRCGSASYIFCNNTVKSMTEIRQNPGWLTAQKPFADLSAKFRTDPLE